MGERKVLEGTNGRKLRRQANGGVLAVDVVQPDMIPPALQRLTVRISVADWNALMRTPQSGLIEAHVSEAEPDKEAIRAVLESGGGVPGCRLKERGESLRVV